MKKTIQLIGISAVIISMVNCSKSKNEIAPNQPTTTQETQPLLNRLSTQKENYIKEQISLQNGNLYNAKINWKLVKADAMGALEGGASGATIGGAVGGIGGAVIGAVGGGIIGGIVGSMAAYAIPIENTTAMKGVVVNPNNQYEFVGLRHNQAAVNILNNKDYYYDVKGNLIVDRAYDYSIQLISQDKFVGTIGSYYNVENAQQTMTFVTSNLNYQYYDFTTLYNQQGKISNTEKEILDLYFDGLKYTVNNDGFQDYSVQFENTITNSSLDEVSKAKLLSVMSLTRYSNAFWDQQKH